VAKKHQGMKTSAALRGVANGSSGGTSSEGVAAA